MTFTITSAGDERAYFSIRCIQWKVDTAEGHGFERFCLDNFLYPLNDLYEKLHV